MPTTRLAIDGLWRCLCPSFSPVVLQVPLRRPLVQQCLNSRLAKALAPSLSSSRQFSASVQSWSDDGQPAWGIRRVRSKPLKLRDARSEDVMKKVEAVSQIPPPARKGQPSISGARDETQPASQPLDPLQEQQFYSSLKELPVTELHDLLRRIRTEEGAYRHISDLVSYLVKIRGEQPCLLYYDALVRANSDASDGSAKIVEGLMAEMKELGVLPDSGFYHSVLQALAIHPDYLLRAEVLQQMKERWFTLDAQGSHNVIIGLLRDRQYEMALDKLEQMQISGTRVQPWLYDILIYVFCEAEELDEALRILQHRVQYGDTDISTNIWYHMLDACSSHYHYEGTAYIWRARVETSYLNPSDGTCTNVLNTAARASDSGLASDVIRVLSQRTSRLDMHHYEALLAAYVNSGDLQTALRILCIMKKARLEPTEGTTRPIFAYLVSQRPLPNSSDARDATEKIAPKKALSLLTSLSEDGHLVPVAAVNAIISAEIMGGTDSRESLQSAIVMYKQLHLICRDGPNTDTFNILLQGCAKTANAKADAMFLASEMVALGIRADELTYDRLVLVCLGDNTNTSSSEASQQVGEHSQAIDEGLEDALRYTAEMREIFGTTEKRAAPLRNGTWTALVKRCADRGDERAWHLLEEMEGLGLGTNRLKASVVEAFEARSVG